MSLPWITATIKHKMNLRLKLLRKAKQSNNPELWAKYKRLRNEITSEVRVAKCQYYKNLFDEVRDCKTYWNLIKRNTNKNKSRPILGIRNSNGQLELRDNLKADILNEHFSTIGKSLAMEREVRAVENQQRNISHITPSIMDINLSHKSILCSIKKLRSNSACGPDNVSAKLLKMAGEAIVPSLFTVLNSSITTSKVPDMWKSAKITAIYKKEDETDKTNYRPISLLCLPGKILESSVASSMTSHIEENGLNSKHQWAYRKGSSTILLLITMTERWRRALDNRQVVGVVFVDLRKAFDSISHPLLLVKLQELGIAGKLWLWIKDYLSNRKQTTTVNGHDSKTMHVEFGVPQGSVLGPTLFALFCNDLPNIVEEVEDGEIEMFADDTTIYVVGHTVDIVSLKLNEILSKFWVWCLNNALTPHPGKTEFMLIGGKSFVGPEQAIKLGNSRIKRVHSTRCLGMELDDELKWTKHVLNLTKAFSQKINLLKSLYFLPEKVRLDFYQKVVLPSLTYGIVLWGSCNKTLFVDLEKMHVRAAKIIYCLDWYMPTNDVITVYEWKTLKQIYLESLAKLVQKIYYQTVPTTMTDLLVKRSLGYNLREKNCLSLPRVRTEMMKKSFCYKGSVLWNNFKNETREIENSSLFSKSIANLELRDSMFY